MTENNAANPGLTTEQILSLERRGNMTDDEALRYGRAIESALLSNLRAPKPLGDSCNHCGWMDWVSQDGNAYCQACGKPHGSVPTEGLPNLPELLRENADLDEAEGGNAQVCALERDAADEIERLRREVSKLRAEGVQAGEPVANERAALTRQDIFDRFSFLEGLVTEHRYTQIAETAIAIYESGAPGPAMADTIRDLRAELGYVAQYGKRVLPDMCPPATSRDRWMYEQGRLAERAALASAPVAGEAQLSEDDALDILSEHGDHNVEHGRIMFDKWTLRAAGEALIQRCRTAGLPANNQGWSGWACQYSDKLPRLYGAREIAELNCDPENGDRLLFLSENAAPQASEAVPQAVIDALKGWTGSEPSQAVLARAVDAWLDPVAAWESEQTRADKDGAVCSCPSGEDGGDWVKGADSLSATVEKTGTFVVSDCKPARTSFPNIPVEHLSAVQRPDECRVDGYGNPVLVFSVDDSAEGAGVNLVQDFIDATDALLASQERKTWTSGHKSKLTASERFRIAERWRQLRAVLVAQQRAGAPK